MCTHPTFQKRAIPGHHIAFMYAPAEPTLLLAIEQQSKATAKSQSGNEGAKEE